MKLYLIASVTISVSCIYLGILGLKGKTRQPIRRLFFLMCCSMGWFLFCAGLSVTAAEKEQVILWYRISSIGFSSFYAFNLHFYISLYRKSRLKLPDLIIYIPVPFVLVGTLVSDSLFNDFVLIGGQWRFFPAYGSIWFWVYFIYYFPYTACTVPILFRRAAKSGLRRHRIQAIAISTFTAVTLIVGSSADFLLPGFDIYTLPPLGPLVMSVYILGLWFTVIRYGFMEPHPAFVANEILDNIHEMVFLLDPSFKILQLNRWSRKTLQIDGDAPDGLPEYPQLTAAPEITASELGALKNSKEEYTFSSIEYAVSSKPVITDSYCARIEDSLSDIVGFIVISRENRDLEKFIDTYRITKRELQVLRSCMAGKSNHKIADLLGIAERTVETHLSNIFNKTGTNNRIELFSLAGGYGLEYRGGTARST